MTVGSFFALLPKRIGSMSSTPTPKANAIFWICPGFGVEVAVKYPDSVDCLIPVSSDNLF